MRHYLRALYLLVVVLASFPAFASAHAFGQQYTLPLPFYLYAEGAVGALIISFLVLALYTEPKSKREHPIEIVIPIRSRIHGLFFKIIGLAFFVFTLVCAFFGSNDFIQNPAPTLFWIILFLGLAYASALVGGLWRLLNPFETIVEVLFLGRTPQALFDYPRWLGYWPALIAYFACIWLELLSYGAGALPLIIGITLLWYGFISCAGAILFGPAIWFTYGDFFSVFFEMIGKFAPFSLESKSIRIFIPGDRLVTERAEHISAVIFILFMLSSTAFDGMHETQLWWNVLYQSDFQKQFYALQEFAVLLLSPFLFLLFYAGAIYAMKVLADARQNYSELLLRFAYSLIPIAVAYNVAHYFTLLLYEGQTLIPLLSDPLSKGWDLFGMAARTASVTIIGAQEVWYTQFGVILGGHIVATYIAHRIALREFDTQKKVIVGQLPILILMVFYTVFGLWILSQAYQNGS